MKNKEKEYFTDILNDLMRILEKVNEFEFNSINKEIGLYIYKKHELDKNMTNDHLYSFLKFVLSGDTMGPYLGNICEVLGKKKVLSRLKFFDFDFLEKRLKPINVEAVKVEAK